MQEFQNPLREVNVWDKIQRLKDGANSFLIAPQQYTVPLKPGRDVAVLDVKLHPPKKGFSHQEGRARLLHDLASIELQAMELGVRSLLEFPEAPQEFREELLAVTLEESNHLKLCLQGLERLGYSFGHFPVHTVLWDCVSKEDSLLDRILIVHRYLEGSGLDASHLILRRLSSVQDPVVKEVVNVIATEEVDHVRFGSEWFRKVAHLEGLDPDEEFAARIQSLRARLPRRLDPITVDLRKRAGFNDVELGALEELKAHFLKGSKLRHFEAGATIPPEEAQA